MVQLAWGGGSVVPLAWGGGSVVQLAWGGGSVVQLAWGGGSVVQLAWSGGVVGIYHALHVVLAVLVKHSVITLKFGRMDVWSVFQRYVIFF